VNAIRTRAKEHFPTVLLTLLSIVQALALELLWSHLHEADYLFQLSWIAAIAWLQIAATVLGIVLIWVVYSGNVMRFRWVPATSDSVFPFFIGLTEFMLIETLGPDEIGLWFIFMALVFGLMNWVAHTTMRRARLDGDNDAYFDIMEPAQLRDFYPGIAIVCGLALAGVYLLANDSSGILAMLALLATNGVLVWQFHQAAQFWELSVNEDRGQR
jgi:hypothetical protein